MAAALAAVALGAYGAPASFQEGAPRTARAAVSVGYVLVPVVVTDAKGRTVAGLKEKDVTLKVDGRPVVLDLFTASQDAPVSFTVLLDGSGSMALAGKMEGARAALEALLQAKHPGDDLSLHLFAEGTVREVVPFTDDAARLRRAAGEVRPFGKTAFYDALAKMPDRSLLGRNGSRAIILLTDGVDNASALSEEGLTKLLEGVDVPVYPIGLRSPGAPITPGPGDTLEHILNLDVLGRIARVTGGRLAIVDDPEKLVDAVQAIERDLRSQYLLGFAPTGKGPVRYRQFFLELSGPPKPFRMRTGYRGTEPPWRENETAKKGNSP
ncbi:MAG: VWA domain-containing protein [Thermoanaerobaculia bacterium]